MKIHQIIFAAFLAAILALAGCSKSASHPARTLSASEQQVATQVEKQAQHCLPKLVITHPITSIKTAVVPCMEVMVPAADRPEVEQQMITLARTDKVWHHKNIKTFVNDLAAWLVAHHITFTASTS